MELAALRHTKTRARLIRVCASLLVMQWLQQLPDGLLVVVAQLYLSTAISHLVLPDRRQWPSMASAIRAVQAA